MIESQPLKSHLIFLPSKKDDGNLTVDEIFNLKIKSSLVTLSACETALAKGAGGKFPQGDDLIGLSRSFIYAGSSSVVASLWQVSDDSTIKLILSFYKNLQRVSKAEALRRAQIELMRSKIVFNLQRGTRGITLSPGYRSGITVNCSHPYFWAPFILIGDWR
jgi:CHAT domain-containing protein